MKAVLISIQPKWCELIASGKKTVEVRKTKPKLETPFKVYIYCTKDKQFTFCTDNGEQYTHIGNGKVIGEFVCDNIGEIIWTSNPTRLNWKNVYNEESCLTDNELYEYSGGDLFYEWRISDLVIYDKPKELSEFFKACDKPSGTDCSECVDARLQSCKSLTRPPQSWCYVEGITDERPDKN
jgi:predicted transcriptional regulator